MKPGHLLPALIATVLLFATPRIRAANPLPRSTPEAQGISSQAIHEYVEAADKVNTQHSFMILRHGHVIAEGWWKPEAADKAHVLASLSKSFNSTAVGLAIADGKLSLDDAVLKFFPDDAPAEISANLKALTVRDLLTMSGGHDTEPKSVGGAPSVRTFLAHPFVHKPGTHFQYNSMGSYTLSAIVTKVTGQTSLEYIKPRFFEPLGIENATWAVSPEGYSLGGSGLKVCTEDIAKLGQFYLQKGKWNGKQLLPEKWVEMATSKQVPNDQESHTKIGIDWQQGYGFQFWRCTHNAFRGDGAGGQLCVVIPDKDAVIAITADTGNFQGEMNAIWDHLYAAFGADALPENPAEQEKVKEAVAKLQAHPAKKAVTQPAASAPAPAPAAAVPTAAPAEPLKLLEPKPLVPGAKVATLWPAGSRMLRPLAGWDQPEGFNMTRGRTDRIESVVNIHNPSIEIHLAPPDKANGMAVIVSAGGGNTTCNVGPEGTAIADWLNGLGIHAFIERYRLRPYTGADSLADTQRCFRIVRANAKEWGVDPKRIGIMGFSAGGALSAGVALKFDEGKSDSSDPIEQFSCRPDFTVLVYAGGRMDLSSVPKNAPPAFLVCAGIDDASHAAFTVDFYNAYFKSKVPVELHIYGHAGHAGGIGARKGIPFGTWHLRFIEWAKDLGYMTPAS